MNFSKLPPSKDRITAVYEVSVYPANDMIRVTWGIEPQNLEGLVSTPDDTGVVWAELRRRGLYSGVNMSRLKLIGRPGREVRHFRNARGVFR